MGKSANILLCNPELSESDDYVRQKPIADLVVSDLVNKNFSPKPGESYFFESPLLSLGETWETTFELTAPKILSLRTNHIDCVGEGDVPNSYKLLTRTGMQKGELLIYVQETYF